MRDTKSRIITAARDIFLENGLEGLTMRAVAETVGISPTAIYRHFKDKEEMLMSVVEEGFRLFGNSMFKALEYEGSRERLLQTGLGYIRFGLENPEFYRLIHMSRERFSQWLCQHGPGKSDATFQFLLDRIRQCQHEGVINGEIDVMEAGLFLWSVVHGLTTFQITGGIPGLDEKDFMETAERIISRSFKGLC